VAVGVSASLDALVDEVTSFVAEGYRRVKLKIGPGWDVEPVAAVRAAHPDLALQVDANGAYRLADAAHLARLDEFGLLLIEQPLADDDLGGHAQLATRLRTPICLDEAIVSARAAEEALDRGACAIVNVKPGRVGGYLEARRVHDVCLARGAPVWCGGMLETGLARSANIALAALPGFTLTGDLSGSGRWFRRDVTPPLVPVDGRLRVPTGPGIGVAPDPAALEELTVSVRRLTDHDA
jgi:O-succinylbenzoate synthase